VLVVAGGAAARAAILSTWAQARQADQACLVVASDDSVVAFLRDSVVQAGGSAEEVIEARRLTGSDARRHEGPLVMYGALPAAVASGRGARCVQVVIASTHLAPQATIAVAAEAARPRYLLSELGAVRSSSSARAAWREGAGLIETFRRRWSIDDGARAFGDSRSLKNLDLAALQELTETRRKLHELSRTIGFSRQGIDRGMTQRSGRSR
jgi:hypothetical protein